MKWIIEMPNNWGPTYCACCPLKECMVDENTIPNFCPLANAKKAVEVENSLAIGPIKIKMSTLKDGKPVTLYAVEGE